MSSPVRSRPTTPARTPWRGVSFAPWGATSKGSVVAVLGLTFKADTDDVRETPALALIDGLKQAGISVRVFDPQGMEHARRLLTEVEFCDSALDACSGADCAVIATEWPEFRDLDAKTFAKSDAGPHDRRSA